MGKRYLFPRISLCFPSTFDSFPTTIDSRSFPFSFFLRFSSLHSREYTEYLGREKNEERFSKGGHFTFSIIVIVSFSFPRFSAVDQWSNVNYDRTKIIDLNLSVVRASKEVADKGRV